MKFMTTVRGESVNKVENAFDRLGNWLSQRWLELVCLAISATRTYDIVGGTSPAVYIPAASVGIMEGGWVFWNVRLVKARNSEQMYIASGAIVLTWIIIGLTVAADAVWIASKHSLFNIGTMPPWASNVAVFSVVIVAMLHIALIGFYQYFDPIARQNREHEQQVRLIEQEESAVMLERDRLQMEARVRGWKGEISRVGDLEGQIDFREQFRNRYGYYPEDMPRRARNMLNRPAADTITYNAEAPAAGKAVEANGGPVTADQPNGSVSHNGHTGNPTPPPKGGR